LKAYRFLDEADQEFQEHIGYFISHSLTTAEKFVDEVRAAVHDIREYPQVGSPISAIVRQRVLTGYRYSILYVDTPSEIIIVAVAPHRRRPGYWRRRLRHLKP
jgi:plasmid stabilization system protein ParE